MCKLFMKLENFLSKTLATLRYKNNLMKNHLIHPFTNIKFTLKTYSLSHLLRYNIYALFMIQFASS